MLPYAAYQATSNPTYPVPESLYPNKCDASGQICKSGYSQSFSGSKLKDYSREKVTNNTYFRQENKTEHQSWQDNLV